MMSEPLLVALNYSGGVQSEWMLWRVLLGLVERPKYFAVFNANPGMENGRTQPHVDAMRFECAKQGIDFVTAPGPDLLQDILAIKTNGRTRLDTPPYWTPGKREVGTLKQACTKHYKIAPMDRAVRLWLKRRWGIGLRNHRALRTGAVEKWIGFTADEQPRADSVTRSKHQRYVSFRFPLIDDGLTKSDIVDEFISRGLPLPERSMCNACPYHGLRSLKQMHDERPVDWAQAVAVDESIRDWSQIGVKEPCFVSKTLLPLTVLAERGFDLGNDLKNDLHQCSSGVCFV